MLRRVSSCINFFEACIAFTLVTACKLAKSPKATLCTRGSSSFVTSTTALIATGWSEPVPGRVCPAVDQRLSRRTQLPVYQSDRILREPQLPARTPRKYHAARTYRAARTRLARRGQSLEHHEQCEADRDEGSLPRWRSAVGRRHGEELQRNPSAWMPWNYSDTLARWPRRRSRNRMNLPGRKGSIADRHARNRLHPYRRHR
jgi:hypothetical protein